jgi:hypothetical protein
VCLFFVKKNAVSAVVPKRHLKGIFTVFFGVQSGGVFYAVIVVFMRFSGVIKAIARVY